MVIEEIREFVKECAVSFGAKGEEHPAKSYIERNNTGAEAMNDGGAYFGIIQPEEDKSGQYHDFSLVIFPAKDEKPWLICLGVGSAGFKEDFELATYPGLRRLFSKLIDKNGYCKLDFSDIESKLPKSFSQSENLSHLKNTVERYSKVLPAVQIISDPATTQGKKVIQSFVAAYAKMRNWPTNQNHRDKLGKALDPFLHINKIDHESFVANLITSRKYIILQGAPGTGKTRLAKEIAKKIEAHTFFTQFHAETSFTDFVYGLFPSSQGGQLNYIQRDGILLNAVKYAVSNPNKKVVLIIDEINRANLSNILGPSFYLFEHKMTEYSDIKIEITPNYSISKLPENFYVIGTMNSADRSLAVVDFALRRRFAWYDVKPEPIEDSEIFNSYDFNEFKRIFDWYAKDDELLLQPGQGYFIATDDKEMKQRIQFELFPLIKEYLAEGLLKPAREEFNHYFISRVGLSLEK